MFSLLEHEAIAKAIPDAELEIIENAGHLATLEAPEEVVECIENFIRPRPSLSFSRM